MTISAGLGIANFPFEDAKGFWRWVDLCDKGGVDSIWQSDRLIGPDPNLECMSVMAALAGATRHLKFGMNVASLGLRDPVLTAKACATIDVLKRRTAVARLRRRQRSIPRLCRHRHPHPGPGQAQRGGPANPLPPLVRGLGDRRGPVLSDSKTRASRQSPCSSRCRCGSAAPHPKRSNAPPNGALAGRRASSRQTEVEPVIAAIKARAAELGRPIDEDHYGAGFAFRFGQVEEPIVTRYHEFLTQRLGKPADGFLAVGDVEDIMELLQRFREADAHKFILRPIAHGTEDFIDQTRLLIERVLPEVAALGEA